MKLVQCYCIRQSKTFGAKVARRYATILYETLILTESNAILNCKRFFTAPDGTKLKDGSNNVIYKKERSLSQLRLFKALKEDELLQFI